MAASEPLRKHTSLYHYHLASILLQDIEGKLNNLDPTKVTLDVHILAKVLQQNADNFVHFF